MSIDGKGPLVYRTLMSYEMPREAKRLPMTRRNRSTDPKLASIRHFVRFERCRDELHSAGLLADNEALILKYTITILHHLISRLMVTEPPLNILSSVSFSLLYPLQPLSHPSIDPIDLYLPTHSPIGHGIHNPTSQNAHPNHMRSLPHDTC